MSGDLDSRVSEAIETSCEILRELARLFDDAVTELVTTWGKLAEDEPE